MQAQTQFLSQRSELHIYDHAENKDAWRCGYAPTCDNINVCRAAWNLNGYCIISGLMNWAQHSDSKTLVKSKIQLLELGHPVNTSSNRSRPFFRGFFALPCFSPKITNFRL